MRSQVYTMLAGFGPFDPPSCFEELEFEARYWKPMSSEVQDFLSGYPARGEGVRGPSRRDRSWRKDFVEACLRRLMVQGQFRNQSSALRFALCRFLRP